MTHHQVQITDNLLWVAVAQVHVAVRGLDVDDLVAPDKGAIRADAADAVSTKRTPCFRGVTQDSASAESSADEIPRR